MNQIKRTLALAALTAAFFAVPSAHAYNEKDDLVYAEFMKMCDTDKDGMVSKAEMMKHVEKMFDKADSKKMGKIDKRQVEIFLQALMNSGGA